MRHRSAAQSTAVPTSSARTALLAWALVITSLLALLAPAARAQSSGDGFLFGEPRWAWGLRVGFDQPTARSDIFDFMTDELTLDRGDFGGFTFGLDLAYSVSPRLAVAVGAGFVRSEKVSEFNDFVGTDDLPIVQTTTFRRLPVTATLKAYLVPRGRTIGSLAWVPTKFAPYVGIGGGAMYYKLRQVGEFVEVTDENADVFDIFYDDYASSGWTPTAHGVLGAEFALTPRLALSTEGRYGWAKSELGDDYTGFQRIDLSGFSATMGLNIRF